MAKDSPDTLHTIIITAIRDEAGKAQVVEALTRITKGATAEEILARVKSLPWTLTRRATTKRASQVVKLLERRGASVKVIPPLPEAPIMRDVAETQILPSAELLSQTQVMSATQFLPIPGEEPAAGEKKPPPAPKTGTTPPAPPASGVPPKGEVYHIEPLSLGGILDRTFQICRRNFWKLIAIVAVPWLATIIVGALAAAVIGVVGLTLKSLQAMSGWVLALIGVTVIPSVVVVLAVIFYLSQGALIHAVSSIYLGRDVLVGEAYRFVLNRLGRFFLTSLLFVTAVGAFTLAPILAGVILFFVFQQVTSSGWWSAIFWLPLMLVPAYGILKLLLFDKVVIIEDVAYVSALKRSWDLMVGKAEGDWPRGYFLRLVILLHLFLLINITIYMLFQAPASIFALLVSDWPILGNIVSQVFSNVGSLIGGIFGSVCIVVFYYDIRNRKEGFDLQMLAGITETQNG